MSKTIALARKHGLVKSLSCKAHELKSQTFLCEFSHVAVIDFESTCWKSPNSAGKNEIIEFPAVLLDVATGEMVQEFHRFVSPSENPRLSDFCMNLTGISQEQVDEGVPLSTSICLFMQWITKMRSECAIKSLALLTWSDWDLNVCLHNECKRKAISKPDIFNQWIDLRALYREHSGKTPRGLRAAVEDMGMSFTGREHSGIDDARNTAKLAWKLYSVGMELRITKTINPAPQVLHYFDVRSLLGTLNY